MPLTSASRTAPTVRLVSSGTASSSIPVASVGPDPRLMPGVPSEEEDCLYLNVYAPEDTSGDVPVMVWSTAEGTPSARDQQYDPSRPVADGMSPSLARAVRATTSAPT
jgi:para-nitrobenzyl esterase